MNYQPRPDDVSFVLGAVLGVVPRLRALPPFAEVDDALQTQVLEEASKFVAEVIAPLNRDGDEIGCRMVDGQVVTPPGFRDAYRAFVDAGWPALSAATEDGGQGLPAVLDAVLFEWLSAANHGLTMAPGLLHGAYECLKHHGSDALKPLRRSIVNFVVRESPLTLSFAPKDGSMVAKMLKQVEVTFGKETKYIDTMVIRETGGSVTTLKYVNTRINEPVKKETWEIPPHGR